MRKSALTLAATLVLALTAALPAVAQTEDVTADEEVADVEVADVEEVAADELSIWFDEEAGELIFGVGVDCTPAVGDEDAPADEEGQATDGEQASADEEGQATDGESSDEGWSWPRPELDLSECNAISVVGPSGKVNHGSVVAAFVHALKNSEHDGPRGQLVSQVAKSDFAKQSAKPEKAEKAQKPEKADKPDKPGKPESPGKSESKGNNGKGKK